MLSCAAVKADVGQLRSHLHIFGCGLSPPVSGFDVLVPERLHMWMSTCGLGGLYTHLSTFPAWCPSTAADGALVHLQTMLAMLTHTANAPASVQAKPSTIQKLCPGALAGFFMAGLRPAAGLLF